ncbi:MAG: hypothetical protein Q4C95_02655 [Planctomycetia bacterium]|nr:hypothetical protein [Planctomycetia bacterium]
MKTKHIFLTMRLNNSLYFNILILAILSSGCQTLRTPKPEPIPQPTAAPIDSVSPEQGVPINVPSGTGSVPNGSITEPLQNSTIPVSQPNPEKPVEATSSAIQTTSIDSTKPQINETTPISLVSGTADSSKEQTKEARESEINIMPIVPLQDNSFNTNMDQYSANEKASPESMVNVSQTNPHSSITENQTSQDQISPESDQSHETDATENEPEAAPKPTENLSTENSRILRYQLADSPKYSSDFLPQESYCVRRTVSKSLPIATLPSPQQSNRENSLTPVAPVPIPLLIQDAKNELSGHYSSRKNQASVRTIVIP